jgi:mannose-6-phosphate isomerase-like protein (cupin superfamily)
MSDYLDKLKTTDLRPKKIKIDEHKETILLEQDKGKSDIHAEIIKWFVANPHPKDDAVHAFAEKLGIDPHKFEEHIYMILSDLLKKENLHEAKSDQSGTGFDVDIETATLKNTYFREVLHTAPHTQLVVMSIKDEIGMETHEKGDQFIRIEGGKGKAIIAGREFPVGPKTAFIIPEGAEHNVINTGGEDLKLYAVYAPPNHPPDKIHKTKEEAESDE